MFRSTATAKVFRTDATLHGITLHFSGPGVLNVVGRRAYYRIYVPSVSKRMHVTIMDIMMNMSCIIIIRRIAEGEVTE